MMWNISHKVVNGKNIAYDSSANPVRVFWRISVMVLTLMVTKVNTEETFFSVSI